MDKKGDLSISMIILIAIGLIVLVVAVYLIIGGGKDYEGATKCIKAGGVCKNQNDPCRNIDTSYIGSGLEYCGTDSKVCCTPLG